MINLVVLNYNDYETTSHLVDLIKDYRILDKIIITDNQSTDDSYEKLCALRSDRIDVIQAPENRGYGSGNNFGIRYALETYHPDYIIISNPDVEFEEKTVKELYKQAQKIDNLGTISCRMNCLSTIALEPGWRFPKYLDFLLDYIYPIGKLWEKLRAYKLDGRNGDLIEVDIVHGSFFMVSADAVADAGGFDDRTFLYCEEDMFAARLHQKGYHNYLLLTEEYIHRHSVSINKSISSVKSRLDLRQESRELYCTHYLHTGTGAIKLLRFFYYIWLSEYLVLVQLRKLKKLF